MIRVTRRGLAGAAAVAAFGALAAGTLVWRSRLSLSGPAQAQAPSAAGLMAPGPLGDEAEGSPAAPVTIIEYASMTCPHCANFDINVFPLIKSRYIDTGKVRYVLREFPLDPLAAAGFMLARCAGNGKFFAMIHVLFQRQREWVVEKPLAPLLEIAKQAGFTQSSFDACLANQDILKGIKEVRERAASKFGVDATPTFFINGTIHPGEMTIEQVDAIIKPYLNS